MNWPGYTALVVTDTGGKILADNNKDLNWEASSTIKVPILLLALREMTDRGASLQDKLPRLARHNSIGSGIINWTEWRQITFHDLVYCLLVYSDCVATNILLDYIGGKARFNSWLKTQGFDSRLSMDYLHFTDHETKLPNVGTTTAMELVELYILLDQEKIPHDWRQLVNYSMSHVHESWFASSLVPIDHFSAWKHKTGSMIDSGPQGETVFNAVGSFQYNHKKHYFSLLSYGWLHKQPNIEPAEMRQIVIKQFTDTLQVTLG